MLKNLLAALLLFSLLGATLSSQALPGAATGTLSLPPTGYTTLSGASGGEPVSALALKDQAGREDDPSRYLTFTTPAAAYEGYRTYQLPEGITSSQVLKLQVKANFRAASRKLQTWTWLLFDWEASTWVGVGGNRTSRPDRWKLHTFKVPEPGRFVSPAGELRLALRSSDDTHDSALDYEALLVKFTPPPAPTPTATPTFTPVPTPKPGEGPQIAGCPIFPVDNIWNTRIDTLPVHARSDAWVNTIGRSDGFHMDFGSGEWDGEPIGIPFNIAPGDSTPLYTLDFYYPDESDPGPYPIPANPLIEGGSDHHLLVLDSDNCVLYELYDVSEDHGDWSAGSGAIFDLGSHLLRPDGWTSADAAGLPILPGLVRYDEILSGEIRHAIRFTSHVTDGYIWPARHLTSDNGNPAIPPMGARFRLKADFDISPYPAELQVLLRAMKFYGIILADNGSDWYVSGAPDERWNNDMLHLLDDLTGGDFEAVDESALMLDPDSGQALQP